MVEIAPALPEEAEILRVHQLAAIRRFLEVVAANRATARVSRLTDSLRIKTETDQETIKRAQGGVK